MEKVVNWSQQLKMQRLGSTWEAVCGLPAWGEIFCLGFHSDIPHGVRFFLLDFSLRLPPQGEIGQK